MARLPTLLKGAPFDSSGQGYPQIMPAPYRLIFDTTQPSQYGNVYVDWRSVVAVANDFSGPVEIFIANGSLIPANGGVPYAMPAQWCLSCDENGITLPSTVSFSTSPYAIFSDFGGTLTSQEAAGTSTFPLTGSPLVVRDIGVVLGTSGVLFNATSSTNVYFRNVSVTRGNGLLQSLMNGTASSILRCLDVTNLQANIVQETVTVQYDSTSHVNNQNGNLGVAIFSTTEGNVVVESLVFRPGGVPVENVYTTEATLAAATQALNGSPYKIFWDLSLVGNTFSPATGLWDLAPNGSWTNDGAAADIIFANETTLPAPPIGIGGYLVVTVSQSTDVCPALAAAVSTTFQENASLSAAINGAFVNDGGAYWYVFLHDSSAFTGNGPYSVGTILSVYDNATASNIADATTFCCSPAAVIDQGGYPNTQIYGLLTDTSGTATTTIPPGFSTYQYILQLGSLYYSNGSAWVEVGGAGGAVDASAVTYEPADAAAWPSEPAQVAQALDDLIGLLEGVSIALGSGSTTEGDGGAIAIGNGCTANGGSQGGCAIGQECIVNDDGDVAIGLFAYCQGGGNGGGNVSIGNQCNALNSGIAIGVYAYANGNGAIALGASQATGTGAVCLGAGGSAANPAAFVTGVNSNSSMIGERVHAVDDNGVNHYESRYVLIGCPSGGPLILPDGTSFSLPYVVTAYSIDVKVTATDGTDISTFMQTANVFVNGSGDATINGVSTLQQFGTEGGFAWTMTLGTNGSAFTVTVSGTPSCVGKLTYEPVQV